MMLTVEFVVCGLKIFSRKSGNTGQELLVFTDSKYPAVVSACDKEECDLSVFKAGDKVECSCDLIFESVKCVSSTGKTYYHKYPALKIIDCTLK